ncbi:MAG TPA: GNAT family N-acetyltransferase [Gemmatimonadales bacterium]
MKMWRPDRAVTGPFAAVEADIPHLNRVFSDAFTDRYRRDGMVGVRVPELNPAIWRYALRDAGPGAMVWRDEDDALVAFNIAHHSGGEGWMGPLAVRPDRQGLGVGGAIVRSAIEWLEGADVGTIGLETMPRTVDNIGFYSRIGFVPGHLTVTLSLDVVGQAARERGTRLHRLQADERADLVRRCQDRLATSAPDHDFTREHELTQELAIGDTVVLETGGRVRAFALWHSAALAESRPADEVRVLKLFAESAEAFGEVLRAVEACAVALSIRRVTVRCQTAFAASFRTLIARGYQVRWTDLRMTLEGYPEVAVPEGEVLFSNWEI